MSQADEYIQLTDYLRERGQTEAEYREDHSSRQEVRI